MIAVRLLKRVMNRVPTMNACDLIRSGQSADEVIKFLTTIRRMPTAEAEKYYQQAVERLKKHGEGK